MPPLTHLGISARWCGEPLELAPGSARVGLTTLPEMAADEHGLVHGGFVFGLADYAAMLAVNHPHVVLVSATVRFRKPVRVGERLIAFAQTGDPAASRVTVAVTVSRNAEVVMEGEMGCAVLSHHVLAERR